MSSRSLKTLVVVAASVIFISGCTVMVRPARVVSGPVEVEVPGVEVYPNEVYVEPPPLYLPGGAIILFDTPGYFYWYRRLYGHEFHERWHYYNGHWRGRGYGRPGYIPRTNPHHPHNPGYRPPPTRGVHPAPPTRRPH